MYCDNDGLLGGSPITDGTVLGDFPGPHVTNGWEGGLVKFDPEPKQETSASWVASLDSKVAVQFQPPIPRPAHTQGRRPLGAYTYPGVCASRGRRVGG